MVNVKQYFSWFGTVSSILGAWLLPLGFVGFAYICFTLGSGTWLVIGIADKNRPLIVLNLAFFGANCLGLYKVFL
jgi:hypothetical protein